MVPILVTKYCMMGASFGITNWIRILHFTLPSQIYYPHTPKIYYLHTHNLRFCFIQEISLPSLVSAAAAKSLQSCLPLCDPIDGSPSGSTVPGILQARTLEWVAISFSSAWRWKVKVKSLSRVQLFTTPWTAAYQAPPSMGFSRQEYWSGLPSPSPLISIYSTAVLLFKFMFWII